VGDAHHELLLWRQDARKNHGDAEKMNPTHVKDLATASTPVVAFTSLSQVNDVAALIGTLLGIAFLLWRWKREASKEP
jgi:hypothetical protein